MYIYHSCVHVAVRGKLCYAYNKFQDCTCYYSWDSIASVVTTVEAGRFGVQILAGTWDFSLLQNIHSSSGAHPTSYSTGLEGTSAKGEVAWTWGYPLTSNYSWGQECVELCLHSPYMLSYLYRDFTFTFYCTCTVHSAQSEITRHNVLHTAKCMRTGNQLTQLDTHVVF